jgi:hypothetical protein
MCYIVCFQCYTSDYTAFSETTAHRRPGATLPTGQSALWRREADRAGDSERFKSSYLNRGSRVELDSKTRKAFYLQNVARCSRAAPNWSDSNCLPIEIIRITLNTDIQKPRAELSRLASGVLMSVDSNQFESDLSRI